MISFEKQTLIELIPQHYLTVRFCMFLNLPQYKSAALWRNQTCHLVGSVGTNRMTFELKQDKKAGETGDKHCIVYIYWTYISIKSEVSFTPILSCDDAVAAVYSSNDGSLKLLGCNDFHGHDWLQDHCVGLFHSCGENGEPSGNINQIFFSWIGHKWKKQTEGRPHLVLERPLLRG